MKSGEIDEHTAVAQLEHLPVENLGFARLDHHRALRCGHPEVVYGAGKTPDQLAVIVPRLAALSPTVLVTRAEPAAFEAVAAAVPDAVYYPTARAIVVDRRQDRAGEGLVAVVAAGTADLPVAEEAMLTASLMGARVEQITDVGVAGIHRLFAVLPTIRAARAVVVVAGMEGALPSVVAGLVSCPVIAVPTSVGYGASFGGLAALLTMLNSCANGIGVVNIDNGFGGGYLAALINARPEDDHA
ncbi:MAG: 1-(5-phosphoribosyl)-5-amino-4-imidazole-carboxylate carboxylase [Dehalococcoidia bacterium]|nr:MAG: 1-(5-phosphoribosyl)-5-amino-4-imidazole-carboxylate carboxylase [Dehalococcoidia bacterium]